MKMIDYRGYAIVELPADHPMRVNLGYRWAILLDTGSLVGQKTLKSARELIKQSQLFSAATKVSMQ